VDFYRLAPEQWTFQVLRNFRSCGNSELKRNLLDVPSLGLLQPIHDQLELPVNYAFQD
jgi:hypothetical protein